MNPGSTTDRPAVTLDGKAVVVTGAGRGLGRAYADAAARHGAMVVVNDVDADAAARVAAQIPGAVADGTDISSWAGAEALVERCCAAFGRIDGLVNNAALIRVTPPQDATEADIRCVVDVNLLGSIYCGIHALRRMVEQGSGSIVNVTSGAALGGLPTVATYAATKGGILSLTYAWAGGAADAGVRVNAVSPDADTPLAASIRRDHPEVQAGAASAESNAHAVVFLLSDRATTVNGQVLLTGGERLGRLSRPTPIRPAARRDEWTADDVADVVLRDWLTDRL